MGHTKIVNLKKIDTVGIFISQRVSCCSLTDSDVIQMNFVIRVGDCSKGL